jgi:hypothetical protein
MCYYRQEKWLCNHTHTEYLVSYCPAANQGNRCEGKRYLEVDWIDRLCERCWRLFDEDEGGLLG